MTEPKILVYDIETYPALAYVWGAYDQNIIDIKEEWGLLGVAWKWYGNKMRPQWEQADGLDDQYPVEMLHYLFNEADITIAHNGDRFDKKKANAQFLKHGLGPASPTLDVDTKKISSRVFGQYKNNLDYLAQRFGIGRKVRHEGFDLWLGCMNNDPKAWARMAKYAKQDVLLLEGVYTELRAWTDTHPNVALVAGETGHVCPTCGSPDVQKRGFKYTSVSVFQQYQCNDCGRYSRERTRESQAGGKGVKLR